MAGVRRTGGGASTGNVDFSSPTGWSEIDMACKPLVAGGKDVPDKPLRAPVFERARQVGQLAGDDRQDVLFEVAALVDEAADRSDVGREVDTPSANLSQIPDK
jgi:hypothetical protein